MTKSTEFRRTVWETSTSRGLQLVRSGKIVQAMISMLS